MYLSTVLFIVVLGIFMGYSFAIYKIYIWMTDILELVPVTLENGDFLWGVIFALKELDKKISHAKKENKEDEKED